MSRFSSYCVGLVCAKGSAKDDSPETFLGAPLGLQVVGQKYEDEKVLAALDLISRIVQAE